MLIEKLQRRQARKNGQSSGCLSGKTEDRSVKATINYTIPTPEECPLGDGDAEEVVPDGESYEYRSRWWAGVYRRQYYCL